MTSRLSTISASSCLAVAIACLADGSATAATVNNLGGSPVVLVVVEDGSKVEISVAPGSSEVICSAGCFVTLPNGDRIGLAADEILKVRDGDFIVK